MAIRASVVRAALAGLIAWFLWLPLADILRYPDRVSVLPNLQADATVYHETAREIAAARSVTVIPVRHPPGWVALLGLLYMASGPSYVAGKLISWIALLLSVALCVWLAKRIHGTRAAWVAAFLCASSPALRAYVGTLQYEVTTAALLLVTLVLAVRAAEASSVEQFRRRAVLAGLAGAMLVLTREPYAAVVLLAVIWIARTPHHGLPRRSSQAESLRAKAGAALMLVVAAAPAVAWSSVQSGREGRLITISEQGPIVIELGNNPRANGTYNAPLVGIGQPTGLAFVRQFPGRTFVLAVRKVLYFWGVLRDGWNVPRPAAVWIWRATTGLLPLSVIEPIARGGWLLIVFVWAIWSLGTDGLRRWWLFPATVAVIMAVHIITLASYRFSVSVLPVMYVLVSGLLAQGAARVARAMRSRAVAAASALLVTILVAMQFQHWPLRVDYDAVDLDGANAGNEIDPISGRLARIADAGRGVRPVVLLPDQYLPNGAVTVTVRARRASDPEALDSPVARIALVHLDGSPACTADVTARQLPLDRFADITVSCRLVADGPATLLLYSLGTVDLSFDTVKLSWTQDR